MFLTKLKTVALVVLTAGLLTLGTGMLTHHALAGRAAVATADPAEQERGQEKKEGERKEGAQREAGKGQIAAVLHAIDAKVGTLTVRRTGDGFRDAQPVNFNLTRTVKVTLDGKDGKVSDLAPGLTVYLTLAEGTEDVAAIRAEGPRMSGVVRSVDAAAGTLTLAAEREERPLAVARDARLTLDGKNATLADVKPGTRVSVQLTADRKTIVLLTASRTRREEKGEAGARLETRPDIGGKVVRLDPAKLSLTVNVQREDERGEERTYTLGKDVAVQLGRRTLTLDDVKPGARINVYLSEDKKTVLRIQLTPRDGEK